MLWQAGSRRHLGSLKPTIVQVFTTMNLRDLNQDSTEQKYISKKVMINGQFVTLYSVNGQTWLSSPEDIPALMERLENARVTLNAAEKLAEGEEAKVAKPEVEEKKEASVAPEKGLSTKYRVKGPKPRPILRQDGVVIQGTPIDPISASSTVMSFSSDVKDDQGSSSIASTKAGKNKGPKIIAPVVAKKLVKAAVQAVVGTGKTSKKVGAKSAATTVQRAVQAKQKSHGKATKASGKPQPSKNTAGAKAAAVKSVVTKASIKKAVAKSTKAGTKAGAKKAAGARKSAAARKSAPKPKSRKK